MLRILKEAGATFLARHTVLQGHEPVDSLKQAIQNPGFSLVQLIYPCVTHYGVQALGTRDLATIYDWFRERTADDLTADENTHFTTGIVHDAVGSRVEFAAGLREFVATVQKGGGNG